MFLVELPFGANWFDCIWAAALLYGMWDGLRTGLLGEIARVIGWILMLWLSLTYYEPFGDYLKHEVGLEQELARLFAFIVIAFCVYLFSMLIRKLLSRWTAKTTGIAIIQNIGGAIAGIMRMALVMTFLTIWLSLTTSPFLHQNVSKESKFGSLVVQSIPSVAAVTRKHYDEKFIFFKDLQRLNDVSEDDFDKPAKPAKKP